jgi:hypothetical protein
MASLDLKTNKLRYTKVDETLLLGAAALLKNIAQYDAAMKQDATTATSALMHVWDHVKAQRNGVAK